MGQRYASGKNSIAQCDRCGFRFKLKQLKFEVVKTKLYQLKVCPECWDPDQPQLQLGMYPVDDPQAVRQPRPDTTYYTAGTGVDGYPTGGSRDIQWGWNPVGGAREFDSELTPNYLVATTYVGTVGTILDANANLSLTGVSGTGAVGNTLGPLAITGVGATGNVGTTSVPLYISGVSSSFTQGTPIENVAVSIAIPGATVRYLNNGYQIARIFWNSAPNQALVQQLSDQLANTGDGQVWLYTDGVPGGSFGVTPPAPGPEICFGRVYQISPFPGSGFTDFYMDPEVLPYPAPQLGDYNVYSYVKTKVQFSIPCPNNGSPVFPDPAYDGYNPTYVNNGATCTLTWVGNAAATLYSTYQASNSIINTRAYARWSDTLYYQPGITMGVVTAVTYVGGAFTITMNTVTAPTAGTFRYSPITFIPVNPYVAYISSGVGATTGLGSVGQSLKIPAASVPGQTIYFNSAPPGFTFDMLYPTALSLWLSNNTNVGVTYANTYMFADLNGGPIVGIGYMGQFNYTFSYLRSFISPAPSSVPGLGMYTINTLILATQFYMYGAYADQYASYSAGGGTATFTWTGDTALRLRDTYALCPVLPVGTEISASVFVYSGSAWIAQQLLLGTLLSMGYSSGTFSMTYTVTNAFVPYPGGTPSAGMMYFGAGGITFLPLVLNV